MSLEQRIVQLRQLIKETELSSQRDPDSVLLLAVSKQQSAEDISEAYQLGITDFGENYWQEAQSKINQLAALPLHWHFIGPIQSNKTQGIASSFNWVHSVSRLKIALLLNQFRPLELGPLNICLQINLDNEASKSGIPPDQASELAAAVSLLPQLKLRGLMAIPPNDTNQQAQLDRFMQLNHLLHSLNQKLGLAMDTLSMGMTNDLIPAIQAGATIVRLGTAIFGKRDHQ